MALRPFARNPKTDEDDETTEDPANEVDQFFSAERRRQKDEAVEASAEPPAPSVKDPGDPGWYPDATTPGLMRYWDGFHLTGQILHVHARAADAQGRERDEEVEADSDVIDRGARLTDEAPDSEAELASSLESLPVLNKEDGEFLPPSLTLVTPAANDAPVVPETPPTSDQTVEAEADQAVASEPVEADTEVPVETEMEEQVDAETEEQADAETEEQVEDGAAPVDDVSVTAPPPDLDDDDAEKHADDSRPEPSVAFGRPVVAGAAAEAKKWAQEAEKAVARATSVGTPETWQEAARLAVVVSEMAQTLQAAAEATQVAAQKADAAQEAAQQSRAAAQRSADAGQADRQAQKAAQEADDAAKRARQAAVEAKEAADRASQALPSFVETEKAAAQEAADAQKEAQRLQEIVGKASKSDTPSAWSEALKLSTAAVA